MISVVIWVGFGLVILSQPNSPHRTVVVRKTSPIATQCEKIKDVIFLLNISETLQEHGGDATQVSVFIFFFKKGNYAQFSNSQDLTTVCIPAGLKTQKMSNN